jgi:histidinol-phosphate aminotransferase
VESRAAPEADFAVDLDAVEELASRSSAGVVYVASPNTPVGTRVAVERVAALADRLHRTTVILDQAFVTLSDHPADEKVPVPCNVVRVRSLTKDHAIAGLRLGYLVAPLELARRIEARRAPWTTSAVAQAAGLAAVSAREFVEESRRRLLADRDALAFHLQSIGVRCLPSTACFLTFGVSSSTLLRQRLLAHGILVRDCASFGMAGFVRVAARPKADCQHLVQALREVLPTC